MPKRIELGYELDKLDRIITMGNDLSGKKEDYSIIIDKKGGKLILTITQKSDKDNPAFYYLDDKIPPDTPADFKSTNRTPDFETNFNNPSNS